MKRVIKKYVIPHKGNNHTPHLLREAGALSLLGLVVGLFFIAAGQVSLLQKSNLAAVLSPVLVDLTNADRSTQNLQPLTLNPLLAQAAQLKANDMATKGYFSHTSPEGLSPWHWFDTVGYKFMYAGENLAINFSESTDVEQAWMNSPGHRANILNERFTEIGIATAQGTYQGQPTIFVAQMFGKPLPVYTATKTPAKTTKVKPKSSVVPKPVGVVKSEATTTVEQASQRTPTEVRTIASEEMFIAVENTQNTTSTPVLVAPTAGTTNPSQYASRIEKILSQPKTMLSYSYGFIAALVLLVGGLIILAEFKKHHIKNLSYGFGILAAMAILMYSLSSIIPQVIVV